MYKMEESRHQDLLDSETKNVDKTRKDSRSNGSFRFNAAAPEFVPRTIVTAAQVPSTAYFYPCFQYTDGTNGSWIYVASDGETSIPDVQRKNNDKSGSSQAHQQHNTVKEIPISDELKQKIIKQGEYMFSDMSMLANESFAKHVYKDPEGYVPINFVTTKKKLKSLNVTNQMVAQALLSSSKLIVSSDGKKVKSKQPFTGKEMEELMLRTVIAENLPDDHSHQNIEKIFNVVGSIKSIRICQPQESSPHYCKGDLVVSNKLHALVEYENHEMAEKAAEKLNDERNWRKGMRVRVMLRRSPRSVLKSRKSDFDRYLDDEDSPRLNSSAASEDDESSAVTKKIWSRNRAKTKDHSQPQSSSSVPTSPSHLSRSILGERMAKGPRMPDGTRGFTMGRGKPLTGS